MADRSDSTSGDRRRRSADAVSLHDVADAAGRGDAGWPDLDVAQAVGRRGGRGGDGAAGAFDHDQRGCQEAFQHRPEDGGFHSRFRSTRRPVRAGWRRADFDPRCAGLRCQDRISPEWRDGGLLAAYRGSRHLSTHDVESCFVAWQSLDTQSWKVGECEYPRGGTASPLVRRRRMIVRRAPWRLAVATAGAALLMATGCSKGEDAPGSGNGSANPGAAQQTKSAAPAGGSCTLQQFGGQKVDLKTAKVASRSRRRRPTRSASPRPSRSGTRRPSSASPTSRSPTRTPSSASRSPTSSR
jgi:hypothetical protein